MNLSRLASEPTFLPIILHICLIICCGGVCFGWGLNVIIWGTWKNVKKCYLSFHKSYRTLEGIIFSTHWLFCFLSFHSQSSKPGSPTLQADALTSEPPGKPKREIEWSHSVVSDTLQPRGLWPTRLLCPWDFPGKNTGVGCQFLLQEIFLTQGLNPGLPHCRQMLYCLIYQGSLHCPTHMPCNLLLWSVFWVRIKWHNLGHMEECQKVLPYLPQVL